MAAQRDGPPIRIGCVSGGHFFYVYAILHHERYRDAFRDILRKELPRIPIADEAVTFATFAEYGRRLSKLHLDYEEPDPWPLTWIENPKVPLSYQVERMKLSKDRTAVIVNDSLQLGALPEQVHHYRLGNRSALEWLIQQYLVERNAEGEVVSDPNNEKDPEYIVRLLGQVVRCLWKRSQSLERSVRCP